MRIISIDTETHDPHLTDKGPSWVFGEGKVIVTGIYDSEKDALYHLDGSGGPTVKKMLLQKKTALVGANIAYDLGWLCYEHNLDVDEVKCSLIDVQVAESFIDEHQSHDLDSLAKKYLKVPKGSEKLTQIAESLGLKGDFRKHLSELWDKGYKDEIRAYVISDADQPYRIWLKQERILKEQELFSAFTLNMDMLKITCKMKQKGIRIDYAKWQENSKKATDIYERLKKDFTRLYGEVNINSSKQLGDFMLRHGVPVTWKITVRGFEQFGQKFVVSKHAFKSKQVWEHRKQIVGSVVEKDKLCMYVDTMYRDRTVKQLESKGYNVICNPSVDKNWMNDNKHEYKVVADLVELKQVLNIYTKFLGPNFERFFSFTSGQCRLHGNFNVVGARQTGRLSSSKPNCQNIPSKTTLFNGEVDLAEMCREIFIPEENEIFVKFDFSGQENKLQAHFAVGENGEYIRRMYNENPLLDEHQYVVNESGLGKEFGPDIGRKYAKNVRFGLAYGMQIRRMCKQFGWEYDFAQHLSDSVKAAAPWVHQTMDVVQDVVQKRGYIKTLLGRRIHLKDRGSTKTYQFYNYLIQGSAADQIKASQVKAGGPLILTVHDEGDYSLPMNEEGYKMLCKIKEAYESSVVLSMPTICEPELGTDWAHLEQRKEGESLREYWDRVCKMVKRRERIAFTAKDEMAQQADE